MASLGGNSNYIIVIRQNGGPTVQANAQAKLTLKIDNRWVNILEAIGWSGDSGGAGSFAANIGSAAQIFSGNTFRPKISTSQVWRGSNGLDINLSLRFDAWDNPGIDVLTPVENLIKMFSPLRENGSSNSGIISSSVSGAAALAGATPTTAAALGSAAGSAFLHPPGPTPYEYLMDSSGGAGANGMFTVMLGKLMVITCLIPTSLDWEFENRFEPNGYPIAANVNVGFMSYVIPDQADIIGYFQLSANGPAQGG